MKIFCFILCLLSFFTFSYGIIYPHDTTSYKTRSAKDTNVYVSPKATIASEVALGFVLGVLCAPIGVAVVPKDDLLSHPEYLAIGAAAGYSIGCASGVSLAGHLNKQKGSPFYSFAGSLAGWAASMIIMNVVNYNQVDWGGGICIGAIIVLPIIGATIGYNFK